LPKAHALHAQTGAFPRGPSRIRPGSSTAVPLLRGSARNPGVRSHPAVRSRLASMGPSPSRPVPDQPLDRDDDVGVDSAAGRARGTGDVVKLTMTVHPYAANCRTSANRRQTPAAAAHGREARCCAPRGPTPDEVRLELETQRAPAHRLAIRARRSRAARCAIRSPPRGGAPALRPRHRAYRARARHHPRVTRRRHAARASNRGRARRSSMRELVQEPMTQPNPPWCRPTRRARVMPI